MEFSTNKITPNDNVKIPSMNGNNAGYMETDELKEYVGDGLITQSITDGDTTHSPSGDAVNGALNAITTHNIEQERQIGTFQNLKVYQITIVQDSGSSIDLSPLHAVLYLGITGAIVRTNGIVVPLNYSNPDASNFATCAYIEYGVLKFDVGSSISISTVRVTITYAK